MMAMMMNTNFSEIKKNRKEIRLSKFGGGVGVGEEIRVFGQNIYH